MRLRRGGDVVGFVVVVGRVGVWSIRADGLASGVAIGDGGDSRAEFCGGGFHEDEDHFRAWQLLGFGSFGGVGPEDQDADEIAGLGGQGFTEPAGGGLVGLGRLGLGLRRHVAFDVIWECGGGDCLGDVCGHLRSGVEVRLGCNDCGTLGA